MSKPKYKSKNEDLFFDYLPEEVFNSLSEEDREHYREYRRYHNLIYSSQQKIKSLEKDLIKIRSLIREEKSKIKGGLRVVNGMENEVEGWTDKLKRHYDHVSHLDRLFKVRVKVELRDRNSKSYKIKTGQRVKEDFEKVHSTYKGEPLKKSHYYYGKMLSLHGFSTYGKRSDKSFTIEFYFGPDHLVKKKLSSFFEESRLNDYFIRDTLKDLMVQFTRFTVFNNSWDTFKKDTPHNLDKLLKWVEYCDKNGINRSEWGKYE
jgi:hypothetical protein